MKLSDKYYDLMKCNLFLYFILEFQRGNNKLYELPTNCQIRLFLKHVLCHFTLSLNTDTSKHVAFPPGIVEIIIVPYDKGWIIINYCGLTCVYNPISMNQ